MPPPFTGAGAPENAGAFTEWRLPPATGRVPLAARSHVAYSIRIGGAICGDVICQGKIPNAFALSSVTPFCTPKVIASICRDGSYGAAGLPKFCKI